MKRMALNKCLMVLSRQKNIVKVPKFLLFMPLAHYHSVVFDSEYETSVNELHVISWKSKADYS